MKKYGTILKCITCTIGIWGEEREWSRKIIWSNTGWEFSKINDNKSQIQKAQRIPSMINIKNITTMHIIFKQRTKTKRKVWKKPGIEGTAYLWRNKDKNYSGLFVINHNKEESRVKRLNYWKKKNTNLKFYMQWNFPSKVKEKLKTFSNKQKLREFITIRPALQEMSKEGKTDFLGTNKMI